jgi:hypothetical protein
VRVDHQADADQHAGHDATEEEAADGDIAGGAVDHRHDARRNKVGHGRGTRDQRSRKGSIIAFPRHFRRDSAAQHRDIRRGGSGNAREKHAEQGDDLR